jgi:sulfide:quinone oxidoreductase
MIAKVLVLGGGVGGTIVANHIARSEAPVRVTVVDPSGRHVYQPGLVDVALGRTRFERIERRERSLLDPRVTLHVDRVKQIFPDARRVALESGVDHYYDALVVAMGASPDLNAIPGFFEGAHHFHTPWHATRVAAALAGFGGGRIVLGSAGFPVKGPASVVTFALLLEEELVRRGLRDRTEIAFVHPGAGALPHPDLAAAAERLLIERGIPVIASFPVSAVDAPAKRLHAADGRALDYDLLILAPPHRPPALLGEAGIADVSGFVRADPATLRVAERMYVLGDAAELFTPLGEHAAKCGAATRRQAPVVAANVLAEVTGGLTPLARYAGESTLLAETGHRRAVRLDTCYDRVPHVSRPSRWQGLRHWLDRKLYFPLLASA